ncbi:MAG: trans-aconitate methyltransferase [Caldimonas sp.]|nr:MAG: trans-aconitate methyltransferase [Caldimonas sp.]
MSGFSVDWLALREPADHAARQAAARRLDANALAGSLRGAHVVLGVLDLACGTGANLRALAPDLAGRQTWTLIDHDPALLAAVPAALQHWARRHGHACDIDPSGPRGALRDAAGRWHVHWQTRCLDLATELDRLPWAGVQLLTASALIDLVSEDWLRRLVMASHAHGAAVWMALGVDGRDHWTPSDPDDALVRAAFGAHQGRDKGFGPALGPRAPQVLVRLLADTGYRVRTAASDWLLEGPRTAALRRALVEGIQAAACEQQPTQATTFRNWARRRQAHIEHLCVRVGHTEVVGWWHA